MELGKGHMDVGLFTHRRDPQLDFWQRTVGLEYDHMGKLGGGLQQHRHHANGSIIKVNHSREPLAPAPASGIVGIRIARAGLAVRRELADPDGNRVALVPSGEEGVTGIAIELAVNSRDAHDRFWRHVMQFDSPGRGVYVCGDTRILIVAERPVERCDDWLRPGWHYTTVQIRDCFAEHAGALARGAEKASRPGSAGRYGALRVRA
ncbi:MAG: hypothetical protein R3E48_16545 [Burkholderiaceae bacterium]